jgi:hypothetical protein
MLFRDEIVTLAAREAEFSALSMCSTKQGYKKRINDTVNIIKKVLPELLKNRGKDGNEEAFEDAQEIFDSMNRACEKLGRKGKGRAA